MDFILSFSHRFHSITILAELNAPGTYFLEALKKHFKTHQSHWFCVLPPLKNPHQSPSVLCTPPFENHCF